MRTVKELVASEVIKGGIRDSVIVPVGCDQASQFNGLRRAYEELCRMQNDPQPLPMWQYIPGQMTFSPIREHYEPIEDEA